jgi:hypothetical protein
MLDAAHALSPTTHAHPPPKHTRLLVLSHHTSRPLLQKTYLSAEPWVGFALLRALSYVQQQLPASSTCSIPQRVIMT